MNRSQSSTPSSERRRTDPAAVRHRRGGRPSGRLLRVRRTLEAIQNVIRSARAEAPRPRRSAAAGWPSSGSRSWNGWSSPRPESLVWRWVPAPAAAASLLAAALFLVRARRAPQAPPPAATAVTVNAEATRSCSPTYIRWSRTWSPAPPLPFAGCFRRRHSSQLHQEEPANDYPAMDVRSPA